MTQNLVILNSICYHICNKLLKNIKSNEEFDEEIKTNLLKIVNTTIESYSIRSIDSKNNTELSRDLLEIYKNQKRQVLNDIFSKIILQIIKKNYSEKIKHKLLSSQLELLKEISE